MTSPEFEAIKAMGRKARFAQRLNEIADRRMNSDRVADPETKDRRRRERAERKALKSRRKRGRK